MDENIPETDVVSKRFYPQSPRPQNVPPPTLPFHMASQYRAFSEHQIADLDTDSESGNTSISSPPQDIPFTPPIQHQQPTATVPSYSFGPRFAIIREDGSVWEINDEEVVEQYIEGRLRALNTNQGDPAHDEIVQRIVFDLITRARLSTKVFLKLRGYHPF